MKRILLFYSLLFLVVSHIEGQNAQPQLSTAEGVIESGKIFVEVLKILKSDKGRSQKEIFDCKSGFSDFCVDNFSIQSTKLILINKTSLEKYELIIQSGGRECSLHLKMGVWTYEIINYQMNISVRKGDFLIEACSNIDMNIK